MYKIPILDNSYFDLTKLDFSFLNVKVIKVDSQEFKNYIVNLFCEEDYKFIDSVLKKSIYDLHAIILTEEFNKSNISLPIDIYKFLLITFPSQLNIINEVLFEFDEEYKNFTISGIRDNIEFAIMENPLIITDLQISHINVFAKKYFKFKKNTYIEDIIENYYNSFLVHQRTFQFISLFICLENSLPQDKELTYRLKRSWAIFCGNTHKDKSIILNNLTKIFELRNKLVHGSSLKKDDYKLDSYLNYLRNLISIYVIKLFFIDNNEFVKLNYNRSEIDKWVTTIGFNDKLITNNDNFISFIMLNFNKKINKEL